MKNYQKLKAIKLILILLLMGCLSCQKKESDLQFSSPNIPKNKKLAKNIQRIVIGSTNNFNSTLDGVLDKRFKYNPIHLGGKKYIKKYIDIFRSTYKDENILVDSGYFISQKEEQQRIDETVNFYRDLKYDAVLLSENELINVPDEHSIDLPFTNANIYDIKSMTPIKKFNSVPYITKNINGVNISIVGLTTYKNELKKEEKISGLLFNDPIASLLAIKNKLKQNSDIIILLLHAKTSCSITQNTINEDCPEKTDRFSKFIKRLPPNFADAIIGGDSNHAVGLVEGIPVIQNYGHGRFFGRLELFYDKKNKKIIKDSTIIHKSTKICSHFFEVTNDCHLDDKDREKAHLIRQSQFKLKKASFLGIEI